MNLLIKNGEIIDGSGGKSYIGDVLVENDVIIEIGVNIKSNIENLKIIDATNLVIAPGFIDIHSHSDSTITKDNIHEGKLQQGITTEVNGNCGFSLFPISKRSEDLKGIVENLVDVEYYVTEKDIKWNTFHEYKGFVENSIKSFGTNQVPLVAHSLLRIEEIGFGDKEITPDNLANMKKSLQTELKSGTFGMSTGLAYTPGCFAKTSELIELCKVLKDEDKVYVSHIRNESDDVLESVVEVLELGRVTGCKVHISHFKAMGVNNHNKTSELINKINKARKDGLRVTADIYPYNASSTMLSMVLPPKVRSLTNPEIVNALANKELCEHIKDEVLYNIKNRGGSETIVINYLGKVYKEDILGKTLDEIAKIFNLSVLETVFKLIIENNNTVNAIYYAISEQGIKDILKEEFVAIGTDGMLNLQDKNACHPRTFGTFPRILAKYVREENVIPLEIAIYKMTKLPAGIINIKNRGELKVGNYADITIFDKNKIQDRSEFGKAFVYPVGINYVIVNGEIAIEESKYTGVNNGKLVTEN